MKKVDKELAVILATALTQTLTNLRRDGIPVENITDEKFFDIFTLLRKKKIVPDAMSILFIYFAFNPDAKIEGAVAYTGTAAMKKSAIKKVVKRVVAEQSEYIESRGENVINGLMGIAMKELRGKADGKIVKELILDELTKSGYKIMLREKLYGIRMWWRRLSLIEGYLVWLFLYLGGVSVTFWILVSMIPRG